MNPPTFPPQASAVPLYVTAWVMRKDGFYGSSHILQEGTKTAVCGTKAKAWRDLGALGFPLEKVYKSLARKYKDMIRHRPNRPNTPCRRCLLAAQKLRDPLERMADIELE